MDALASSDLRADLVSLVNVLFGVTPPTTPPARATVEAPEAAVTPQTPSSIEVPSIELPSTPTQTTPASSAGTTEQPPAPEGIALPEATARPEAPVVPAPIPVPELAMPQGLDAPAETHAAPAPEPIPVPELAVEQPKVSTKRSMALLNEIGFLDD